ncbi:hypothetical protein ASPSYDRAFT_48699 [Aspergillus sydowii CBS 593.65]|uniref:Uncharacterized protein n=1 Tax=Aspergillus sydowii CBS 593.65 TaxID=1036612 RepID=A0A1L9T7T0_9EURO|nr:uncharacterized protein ASPSYDRAFT_48699 [Aspergillus sydowii CBS 593.65]OJJ55489.1 hypothetical protein ASPSYDRAFT_48699 [Aspergillus sydowii CBS 593.65]
MAMREYRDPISPELTARILAHNQTAQERNGTKDFCSCDKARIWLRTCYDPKLEEHYETTRSDSYSPRDFEGPDTVFKNEVLYSISDWREFLLRVPSLTDVIGGLFCEGDNGIQRFKYCSGLRELYEDQDDISGESVPVFPVSERVQVVICLLDREAIVGGYIKIIWLDEHGHCICDN